MIFFYICIIKKDMKDIKNSSSKNRVMKVEMPFVAGGYSQQPDMSGFLQLWL